MKPDSKPHSNPSDGPPSARRGFNTPEIDPRSVAYHDLRSRTGISDEAARKQLGIGDGHPIETPDLIRHKQGVLDQLARDAADVEAAVAKRAAAQAGLHVGLLGGLDAGAAKMLEERVIGACHGSPSSLQNVVAVLRELGFPR